MTHPSAHVQSESLNLDTTARASASGQFIKLSAGTTHYEIGGTAEAQTVVLVHGFSVPYYIWDPTFKSIVDAHFQTLRYDLFGRGFSDRPFVTYDLNLFDQQLLDLLSALDIKKPVDLIGCSMGGAISIVFADRHPDLVRKLCLIDPSGLPRKYPVITRLLRLPFLGEFLINTLGDTFLASGQLSDFYAPDRFLDFAEKYRSQMIYRGFKRALLSTIRNDATIGDLAEAYRRVGMQERAILLLWGRQDKTIPLALSKRAVEALPQAQFHIIDQAGHMPQYEHSEIVNPLIIDFLRN